MERHSDRETQIALERLATRIEQLGMAAPARIALGVLAPLDVISSQVAIFARPFTIGSRWCSYADALGHEHGWQELRRLLAVQD